MRLEVGGVLVELRHADIHSHDGTVLLLPETGLMLAGDTLEDPITYVAEPDRLEIHLESLRRMAEWQVDRILPDFAARVKSAVFRGANAADHFIKEAQDAAFRQFYRMASHAGFEYGGTRVVKFEDRIHSGIPLSINEKRRSDRGEARVQ